MCSDLMPTIISDVIPERNDPANRSIDGSVHGVQPVITATQLTEPALRSGCSAKLGGYDLMAEMACRGNDDMIRVLDIVRAIPGITQVDTYSVLRVEKENWPLTGLARD